MTLYIGDFGDQKTQVLLIRLSPVLQVNATWPRSDQDKASHFSSYLHSLFKPHPKVINETHTSKIQNELLEPLPTSPLPKVFHPSDIQEIIKNLPTISLP